MSSDKEAGVSKFIEISLLGIKYGKISLFRSEKIVAGAQSCHSLGIWPQCLVDCHCDTTPATWSANILEAQLFTVKLGHFLGTPGVRIAEKCFDFGVIWRERPL